MSTREPLVPLEKKGRRYDGCGFDLRGLTVARCPECGKTFDPIAHTPFEPPVRGLLVLQMLALGGAVWLFLRASPLQVFPGFAWLLPVELSGFPSAIEFCCASPLAQLVLLGSSFPLLFGRHRLEQKIGIRLLTLFGASVVIQLIAIAATL